MSTAAPSHSAAPPAPLRLHGGMSVGRFWSSHFMAASFPLLAGLLLYGWRAVPVVGLVCGSAALAAAAWGRIGARGRQLHPGHTLWLAVLLAMMLPATFSRLNPGDVPWALPAAAGVLLVVVLWVLGGMGSGRLHPVLVTYLFLVIAFPDRLVPYWVLQRDNALTGDLYRAGQPAISGAEMSEPWAVRPSSGPHHAVWAEPAERRLIAYTIGRSPTDREVVLLAGLIRDRMPPLEDLVLGGQPGPIGAGSAIAVIIGGLFLLYRGVIDYRIPLFIVAVAFVALMVLPVPTAITDRGPQWWWAAVRDPRVRWATAVTFVNYELLASPALFMAFFLATSPSIRPMTRRARTIYAALIGVATAAAQLYASVAFGPYVALLAVSLLTPLLDRAFQPRPLV